MLFHISIVYCFIFYNFIYALRTLKMFLFGLFWLFQFTSCSNWLFRSVVSLYVQFYRRSTAIHSPQKYTISRPLLWGFQCRLKTRIPNNSQSQSGRFSCFFFRTGSSEVLSGVVLETTNQRCGTNDRSSPFHSLQLSDL